MLCCESTTDERSAGNPHATFCGSRGLGPRRPGGCGNGVTARVLGHRQTKGAATDTDRKSTRLNSSHLGISYAVFCLKKNRLKNVVTAGLDRASFARHEWHDPWHC